MNAIDPIRVLLVDDSATFLRGLESFLSTESDIALAGNAICGRDAIARAHTLQPQVALMDLRLTWTNDDPTPLQETGLRTIQEMNQAVPGIRIIVISSFSEQRWVVRAMDAGAQGFLAKEAPPEQIIAAIRTVAAGGVVLSAEQLAWLRKSPEPLTRREKDVLALLVGGKSDAEIARQLHIATRTASKHVENIREKLGVSSRWEAVIEARRRGWI